MATETIQTKAQTGRISLDIDYEKSVKYQAELKRLIARQLITHRFINFGRLKKIPKVFGFVGQWGSGKSLSGAAMTAIDYMLDGYTVYSNMEIKFGIRVGNMIAAYSSKPLKQASLFRLQLKNALLFIDEINIEFAEARRAMTNKNLKFSKVIQMIRKRHLSLIYTVISEMYVEPRLRNSTSIFTKCADVALEPGGHTLPFDFGTYIKWRGYDLMGILGKGSYWDTRQLAYDLTLNARQFWNIYDTDLVQGDDDNPYSEIASDDMPALEVETAEHIKQYHDNNEWLFDIINRIENDGRERVPADEIYNLPEVQQRRISRVKLSRLINQFTQGNITTTLVTANGKQFRAYKVPLELALTK